MDRNAAVSFQGAFRFSGSRKLDDNQYLYLLLFWQAEQLHQKSESARDCADPVRELVGLPFGADGEFFVGSEDFFSIPVEKQVRFRNNIRGDWIPNFALKTAQDLGGYALFIDQVHEIV